MIYVFSNKSTIPKYQIELCTYQYPSIPTHRLSHTNT